jgi:hypothetical protein
MQVSEHREGFPTAGSGRLRFVEQIGGTAHAVYPLEQRSQRFR